MDPISPPCILDFSSVDMPQCQYQPAYIIMSISHPWPRATGNMLPSGHIMSPSAPLMPPSALELRSTGLGRHQGGLWRHNVWPLCGIFSSVQCPSAGDVILFQFVTTAAYIPHCIELCFLALSLSPTQKSFMLKCYCCRCRPNNQCLLFFLSLCALSL